MTQDLHIRPVRDTDIPALCTIYDYYVKETVITYEELSPTHTEMQERVQAILDLGMPYLIAEQRGHVVGYSYVGSFRTRAAYRYYGEHAIYLDPEARGHGLGTQLMGALIQAAEKTGIRQLLAVIGGRDNHPSIKLHEKFDFSPVGILTDSGYKFDRWIDTVLMQRAINTGGTTPPNQDALLGLR